MFKIALFLLFATAHAANVYVASNTNTAFSTWNYKCDGNSDNVEIQSAVDSVISQGGGTVWLSDGTFELSKNVDIKGSYVTLRGVGRDVTILKLKNKASKFSKAGFIRSMNYRNIEIRDMTLDGNTKNQYTDSTTNYGRYGIYTETCNYTTFDNLVVQNWYGYGLDPHGGGGIYAPGFYTTITNNIVKDNGIDGITVDKTENSVVAYNTVINNARHGINIVTGSKFTNIYENNVRDNGWYYGGKPGVGCGIMVQNNQEFDTRDAQITSNYIFNASRAGICLTDVENIRISTNQIIQTSLCMRVKNITVSDNIIVDSDNICDGTSWKDDSKMWTGPIPVFLPSSG